VQVDVTVRMIKNIGIGDWFARSLQENATVVCGLHLSMPERQM